MCLFPFTTRSRGSGLHRLLLLLHHGLQLCPVCPRHCLLPALPPASPQAMHSVLICPSAGFYTRNSPPLTSMALSLWHSTLPFHRLHLWLLPGPAPFLLPPITSKPSPHLVSTFLLVLPCHLMPSGTTRRSSSQIPSPVLTLLLGVKHYPLTLFSYNSTSLVSPNSITGAIVCLVV